MYACKYAHVAFVSSVNFLPWWITEIVELLSYWNETTSFDGICFSQKVEESAALISWSMCQCLEQSSPFRSSYNFQSSGSTSSLSRSCWYREILFLNTFCGHFRDDDSVIVFRIAFQKSTRANSSTTWSRISSAYNYQSLRLSTIRVRKIVWHISDHSTATKFIRFFRSPLGMQWFIAV